MDNFLIKSAVTARSPNYFWWNNFIQWFSSLLHGQISQLAQPNIIHSHHHTYKLHNNALLCTLCNAAHTQTHPSKCLLCCHKWICLYLMHRQQTNSSMHWRSLIFNSFFCVRSSSVFGVFVVVVVVVALTYFFFSFLFLLFFVYVRAQ